MTWWIGVIVCVIMACYAFALWFIQEPTWRKPEHGTGANADVGGDVDRWKASAKS